MIQKAFRSFSCAFYPTLFYRIVSFLLLFLFFCIKALVTLLFPTMNPSVFPSLTGRCFCLVMLKGSRRHGCLLVFSAIITIIKKNHLRIRIYRSIFRICIFCIRKGISHVSD